MRILGIETSCDDTSVSVIEKRGLQLRLLSHVRFSQIKTHAEYGGVIPEVAAREHAVTIVPTFLAAIKRAHTTMRNIHLIAVTQGPGLAPALGVGIDTARILSKLYAIPLVGINHIEGHMASIWPIKGIKGGTKKAPPLPALALVVSGGHTELQQVKRFGSYRCMGRTRDDAAGEAFDKVATLLHLPYPGGPKIGERALAGNRNAFNFPRPMLTHDNHDFSFAGLKTAVRYSLPKKLTATITNDICASFEQAVVDVLIKKTLNALAATKAKSVWVVGGVSANAYLRSTLQKQLSIARIPLVCAPHELTQDNGVMIAMAAALDGAKGSKKTWQKMDPRPDWELN